MRCGAENSTGASHVGRRPTHALTTLRVAEAPSRKKLSVSSISLPVFTFTRGQAWFYDWSTGERSANQEDERAEPAAAAKKNTARNSTAVRLYLYTVLCV